MTRPLRSVSAPSILPSGDATLPAAQNTVRVEGKEAEGAVKLVAALEDHDDVQNVYSNMDVDDAVLESVG